MPNRSDLKATDKGNPKATPQLLEQQHSLAHAASGQLAAGLVAASTDLRNPQDGAAFMDKFQKEVGLPADIQAIKDKLIVSSPAKFLRVNPALFYVDLKGPYAGLSQLLDRPSPTITIDGDAHLGNFGTVRAADGSTIWGLNDYDMAGKGKAEWDLERLATSLILMGHDGKLSETDAQSCIKHMAAAYCTEMAKFDDKNRPTNAGIKQGDADGPVAKLIDKSTKHSQAHMLDKFAVSGPDGYTKLQRNAELLDSTPEDRTKIGELLKGYEKTLGATPGLQRPLEMLDLACRVESGGSTYGLHRYYGLFKGTDGEPRILEIKQELPTAPEQATGDLKQANAEHIFSAMKAAGGTPDPMMGYATMDGTAYFIREREKEKGTLDLTDLSASDWKSVAEQAGTALAKAHAHQPGAATAINHWIGKDQDTFIANLQKFAKVYAQQTRDDTTAYASLKDLKEGAAN